MSRSTLTALVAAASSLALWAAPARAQLCNDEKSCAKFCNGSSANIAALKAKGIKDPTGLVQLSKVASDLGCTKKGGPAACGFEYFGGQVVAPVAAALVKAVHKLRAINPLYVLAVDSSFRSVFSDTARTCDRLKRGLKEASGKLCGIELVCPGPNSHSDGYALDVHLRHRDKLRATTGARGNFTMPPGPTKTCKKSVADIRAEKAGHAKTLNEVFYSLGFWRYCWEDWHFELSKAPLNDLRTNCLSDSDCHGGQKCLPRKPKGDPVLACR